MPLFALLGSSRWVSTGPLPLKNMNSIIIKRSSCTLLSSTEAADNGGAMGLAEAHGTAEQAQANQKESGQKTLKQKKWARIST